MKLSKEHQALLRKLTWLWRAAAGVGAVCAAAALAFAWSEGERGWIIWVMAFGFGVLCYCAAFTLLVQLFSPGAKALEVEDDVHVEGDNVVVETTHAQTGDGALDLLIRAYAWARGTTLVTVSGAVFAAIMISIFGW